jgi:zinc/manganese transport system permease protein
VSIGWNLVGDLRQMWSYAFMANAFEASTPIALLAGVVGYFVVLRRSSFAAHALSHVGFAGGAGAALLAVNPLVGLLVFCVGGAAAVGGFGERLRDRDVVIGIVLMFALGLGYLFINEYKGNSADVYSILFGQVFAIDRSGVVTTVAVAAIALVLVALVYRPLLFASVDADVAATRGIPVRALSVGFMMLLGVAVAVSVQIVGVLLIFALLVAPAAVAERLCSRPGMAVVVSAGTAVLVTWAALTAGFYWSPPVSFFLTTFATALYVVARVVSALRGR